MGAELGLRRFVPFLHPEWQIQREAGPAHLRAALQELGATFIKFGQLLSTRADILPPDYIAELAKLQDALPPLPAGTVAAVIEQELGASPEALFAEFDPVPLAAASTSQVHAARLRSGEEVAVKVQRPGVAALFTADLEIVRQLAGLAEARTTFGRDYDLVGLADEMASTLLPSLDYRNEALNIERFREQYAADPRVYIPRMHAEYSTSRVLTVELLRGAKITDIPALERMGVDRHELALTSARVLLESVFESGFFHADPHPGNYFVQPGGRLAVIDFGLVGHISAGTREELIRLFVAVVARNGSRVADSLVRLGALNRPRERQGLVRDLERLLDQYFDLPLGDVPIGKLFADSMRVARRRSLQLPTNLALMATVVATNEGVGRELDPGFRLLEAVRPYAQHLLARTLSPAAMARRLGQGMADTLEVLPQLPGRIETLLDELESGGIEVSARSDQVERLGRQLNQAANRLALSILAAAFIIGCSVLLVTYRSSSWTILASVLFGSGFVAAFALGLWLAISILRSE